jgi:hypothetical protein
MAIDIVLLGPQDSGVLANIAPDVFDYPIDPGRADEFLADPRHHLAVAVEDGWVVGFVSAVHYVHPDKPRPELWINEISVAATHRGRGLVRVTHRYPEPANPWAPFEPTAAAPSDLRKVAHLHRRAGFGATWSALQRCSAAS